MLCPECNHPLLPITLKVTPYTQFAAAPLTSRIQHEVALDYCSDCGGVWSDQGEVNFIHSESLQPLLNVLPQTPTQTHTDYRFLICPRDRSSLRVFNRESIPSYLTLLRCNTCGGIWFPHATLPEFKAAQEIKLNYFKAWKIPLTSVYAILLPLLILFFLGTGIYVTLTGVQQKTETRTSAEGFISEPLAISLSNTSVLISFNTKSPATTKINYWSKSGSVTEIWVSQVPKTNHTLVLRNLETNLIISYQLEVISPQKVTSPIYTFSPKP